MKALGLLLGVLLTISAFSQNSKQPKEIYFEGIIKSESTYDYISYVEVKITKGPLAGRTEILYFSTIFNDKNQVVCGGNAENVGVGISEKKRIKGKIIESTGKFEDYERGGVKTKKCYRPTEINWN
jgi:hypothetical protein